ncbi:MAG: hypothetical protein ACFCUV_13665 [Rivularia sp. (in: cyanobacteria)]
MIKLIKVVALPALLCIFAAASSVAVAEVDSLPSICSKFPFNSECQGNKASAPISFDTRSGEKAKCLFSGEEKAKTCKVDVTNDGIKLYFETGKELDVLNGEKNTQSVFIPTKTIKSFSYSEKKKVDVGAVIALGVWGLLAKQKRSTMAIRYQEEPSNQKQVVFVIGRKDGRQIRQNLELQTGLVADILGID